MACVFEHRTQKCVTRLAAALWIGVAVGLSACSERNEASTTAPKGPQERGRAIYLANCTACHNRNPALQGSVGPEILGSSRELLEARILRAEYPSGYTPKWPSRAMTPLPHLAPHIDDLAAFLAANSEGSERP